MKKKHILTIGSLLIAGQFILTSCEKKYPEDFEPYNAGSLSAAEIALTYNSPLVTLPVAGAIVSDTPTFAIKGPYMFEIDTVYASPEASFNYNRFGINAETGQISYDNSNATITQGSYFVNVAVLTVTGVVYVDSVLEIRVQDVPIQVMATPDNVVADALETGVISQLSYEVIGNPDPPVANVTYTVEPPVSGFSVNENGEVIKDASTETGVHILSFKASSNYGDRIFDNILTVEVVGSAPTLQYTQQDGTAPLTAVTLSPWSAYTTSAPVIGGITAESWSLILPGSAPPQMTGSMSIGSDGSITVAADSNIPEGDYLIGVSVNGAGANFEFPDLFTLTVETRWNETPVLSETFDYALEGGTPLEAPFSSLTVNDGVPDKTFTALNFIKDDPPRNLHSARLFYAKDGSYDVVMILELTNSGSWRDLRVKFSEFFGYGAAAVELFDRTLWYAHDNEAANGTFTPSNWTQVMASDDPDWLTENLWAAPETFNDGDLPSTPYKQLGGLDPQQNDIFICWRYYTDGSPDTGAQWFLDDVFVQAAEAYAAEEE